MVAEQKEYIAEIQGIKYHLLKIDALYAALIKESLNIISELDDKNVLLPLKLLSHQHVYLEQIAAHRVVITKLSEFLPNKKFNFYYLQNIFMDGELGAIDTLMRCIGEKIGFMIGVENQSNKILADYNLGSKWHTRLLLSHKKELSNYFRRPIWQLF